MVLNPKIDVCATAHKYDQHFEMQQCESHEMHTRSQQNMRRTSGMKAFEAFNEGGSVMILFLPDSNCRGHHVSAKLVYNYT